MLSFQLIARTHVFLISMLTTYGCVFLMLILLLTITFLKMVFNWRQPIINVYYLQSKLQSNIHYLQYFNFPTKQAQFFFTIQTSASKCLWTMRSENDIYSPPPLLKMIFFPPLVTHRFSTPIMVFLPSSLFCIYFTLLLPLFSFSFLLLFLSSFFLFLLHFPLFFLFTFSFFFTPNDISWYPPPPPPRYKGQNPRHSVVHGLPGKAELTQ